MFVLRDKQILSCQFWDIIYPSDKKVVNLISNN